MSQSNGLAVSVTVGKFRQLSATDRLSAILVLLQPGIEFGYNETEAFASQHYVSYKVNVDG